ncbi:MAG: hypothetical protein QOJ00_772 [Actinomycetota bacterium]|jgi:ribosomal protein S18 acetylase RimI-like enzyme
MRSAEISEVASVRKVVGEAFARDPLFKWMFPADAHRLEMTAVFLGLFVETYVACGRVDVIEVDGEIVAAALWRIPDDPSPPAPTPPSIGGVLAAFVGEERAPSIFEGMSALATTRPEPPFAYLHLLAVAPSHQRRGYGREVIAPGIAAAEEAGLDAVLETMNEENLAFYGSLGFVVTAELAIGADGPRAWALRRAH